MVGFNLFFWLVGLLYGHLFTAITKYVFVQSGCFICANGVQSGCIQLILCFDLIVLHILHVSVVWMAFGWPAVRSIKTLVYPKWHTTRNISVSMTHKPHDFATHQGTPHADESFYQTFVIILPPNKPFTTWRREYANMRPFGWRALTQNGRIFAYQNLQVTGGYRKAC